MLRKPDFRFVHKEDLGKNAPSWVDIFLDPFNDIIEFIIDAFNHNISVSNLNWQTIDYSFQAPFKETRFEKNRNEPIKGVVIAFLRRPDGSPGGGYTGFDWREEGDFLVVSGIYSIAGSLQVRFFVMY